MHKNIVFIHGMWATGEIWQPYVRFFTDAGYMCHTPTLLQHKARHLQDCPDTLGTLSLNDYESQLTAFIEQFETPPIVIGHSMGGLLAQKLAAKQLASAVVLLMPAAPAGMLVLLPSVMRSFFSMQIKPMFWTKPHKPPFNEAVYACLHLVDAAKRQAIYDTFVYESGRAAAETGYWFLDKYHASKVDESMVTCPMLVVSGKDDRITPASIVKKVAKKYKQATYKMYQNQAHWVFEGADAWTMIAQDVLNWLADLERK